MATYGNSFTPADLEAFAALTVVPGITVGDLSFVQAMSLYSTGLITPSAANTLGANSNRRLFQVPIGGTGGGYAAAYTHTRSETNLEVRDFKNDANMVFVATHACFAVSKRSRNAGATTEIQSLIPSTSGLWSLLQGLYWEVTVGDNITRNYGLLKDYPQGGGIYGIAAVDGAATAVPTLAAATNGVGAQNGNPSVYCARPLSLPIVAPPNIGVNIEVKNGTSTAAAVINDNAGGVDNWLAAAEFIQIRCTLEGYQFTMPVG